MAKKRDALPEHAVTDASRRIRRLITQWVRQQGVSQVVGYYPIRHEPNLLPLLRWFSQQGQPVYLPAWNGTQYVVAPWHPHQPMAPDPYGIPTPSIHPSPAPTDGWVWLVPGLAFSPLGHRLGYGKGHYDRLLGHQKGIRMGVGYHWQLHPTLPQQAHDVPMTHVATDTGIVTV